MAWLRLIRWTNLLIIFATQFLVWFCVLKPIEGLKGTTLFLNEKNFLLLSLSTIFIAAAGYIINDYFDVKIDNINRPEKMVLDKIIPRKHAIIVHSLLNIIAVFIAIILAWETGHLSAILLQVFCTGLLWFYSTKFKQKFAIGNVVVAVLTSLSIVVILLYEPMLQAYCTQPIFIIFSNEKVLPNPVWVLAVYAFFAFILTWMREAVKDMEDFIGDEAEGCVTMPIVWGLKKTAFFTITLAIVALIPLLIVAIKLLLIGELIFGLYLLGAVILPIISFLFILPQKTTKEHYHSISRLLKFIMVTGICSLIIFYFEAHG